MEALTPWIPVMGVVAGGIVVGFFGAWNRRRGNEESKMPTVDQIWAREERQGQQLTALHTAYARLRGTFAAYVFRARNGGDTTPTETEIRFLTLSSVEAITAEQKEQA